MKKKQAGTTTWYTRIHHGQTFLDVARPRSDARPDFSSVRARRALGGDPPAGGPGKEAAQRQGTVYTTRNAIQEIGVGYFLGVPTVGTS
eukprot:197183-Prorocentrum_minimum.AAC.1